jgi:moderate conductance mechanosensitive channel
VLTAVSPSPSPGVTTSPPTIPGTSVTGKQVGHWFDVFLGPPLTIFFIVVVAIVARFLLHRLIDKIAGGVISGRAGLGRFEDRLPSVLVGSSPLAARREQRGRTMASVLKSLTTATIGAIAILMILDELGIPTGPLLASAGIVGIALGFGAQALVRDIISGVFMLVEDQYGVGDVVDLGDASGVVEAVGLRVTRVRDVDGTVWYIRNGEVMRVGNRSQGWARAVLDVGVAYGEDIARAERVLLGVAQDLKTDEQFGPLVLEEPEMWGVESMTADSVVLRLVVKTQPLQQWTVARELRRRIKERLDAEGVRLASPQPTASVGGAAPAGPPAPRPTSADGAAESHPVSQPAPRPPTR